MSMNDLSPEEHEALTRPTDGNEDIEELWWVIGSMACGVIAIPAILYWLMH